MENPKEKKRILIQFDSCPYCKRVREYLDNRGIEYEKLDIRPQDRSLVMMLSGQPSVPILVEVVGSQNQDDDIIEYFESQQTNHE